MDMYFKVVHNDINQCLEQIKILRTPNLVPTDPLEVEIKVNVALRAKLISEVKVNICKLKVNQSYFQIWNRSMTSYNSIICLFVFPTAYIK